MVYHVTLNSIAVLGSDVAALKFLSKLLGYPSPWSQDPWYQFMIFGMKKLFKKNQDIRMALKLVHHRKLAKYFNFDRSKLWSIDFNILVYLVIIQVYAFLGNRPAELLPAKTTLYGLKVKHNQWIRNPVDDQGVVCGSLWKVKIVSFKTQKYLHQQRDMILGITNDDVIDPAYFWRVYRQRRVKLARAATNLKIKSGLRLLPDNFEFVFSDGSPVLRSNLMQKIFTILSNIITIPDNQKLTLYSLRIGLATMMAERSIADSVIYEHAGWSPPNKSSLSYYVRLSETQRAAIPKMIIDTPIHIQGMVLNNPQ